MNKIEEIIYVLDKQYPDAKAELNYNNNFELLIAVTLSAQTTDKRVNSITKVLFNKYKDASALEKASLNELEVILKPLGLYKVKANNIKNIAKILVEKFDSIVPSDRDSLESLPGVGRKTCNVVLSNAFNIDAFAVDTHVKRVSIRLGFALETDDVLEIEYKLMDIIPKNKWSKMHHQLILFGRYMCLAKKPLCGDCELTRYCNYYLKK